MFDPTKAETQEPTVEPLNCNIYVNWSWPYKGFGQLSVFLDDDKIVIGNEGLSKESVRKILYRLADHIIDTGKPNMEMK